MFGQALAGRAARILFPLKYARIGRFPGVLPFMVRPNKRRVRLDLTIPGPFLHNTQQYNSDSLGPTFPVSSAFKMGRARPASHFLISASLESGVKNRCFVIVGK
jgi:hypothetical protein